MFAPKRHRAGQYGHRDGSCEQGAPQISHLRPRQPTARTCGMPSAGGRTEATCTPIARSGAAASALWRWCSLATEPDSRLSGLALLSGRQHEPVTCRRGSRCTLGPGRRGITACWSRRCRAREAAGCRAAVAEASSRPAWRSLVQWRKLRSRAPQPHPSVVESVPLRELVCSFAPERL